MSALLRICTAGSVDDGKSTLIGRLLHDSRSVYEDQISSVEVASKHRGVGAIDYSLFTDGLKAEREQGITIDVAYRYFATARRKFILADTPGHEQYTRNMATGASTADVAILLVDARNGLQPQSERHARIARLLGISSFVLAVNKMDLLDFDEQAFRRVVSSFERLLQHTNTVAIPLSALHGDNVTESSTRTPWYLGPSLLTHLETVSVARRAQSSPFRFPVQLVLRPNDGFRGYAGRIRSGNVRVGDEITVQPSGRASRIERIVTRDGDLTAARAPMSVTLTLSDQLDVSRGDAFVVGSPRVGSAFTAEMVWMDERPLNARKLYRLKHTTRSVSAEVTGTLGLNDIGTVSIRTTRPLVFDPYRDDRATGSFILVDPETNFTAAAGMITEAVDTAPLARDWHASASRIVTIARDSASDHDAVNRVKALLEELF